MKDLYFAYGSNLNIKQMKERCPDSVEVSSAVLSGWKLVERKYADIEESAGECVNGALYEISKNDLASLDRYEGYPDSYTRKELMVADNFGVFRKAHVYMMTEDCAEGRSGECYTEKYRKICSDGAEYWGIPNSFALQEKRPSTLWTNGVPGIADGLEQMLSFLDSGKPLLQVKHLWCGADIVISMKPQTIEDDNGFYPAPTVVATPYAQELTWVFQDLRDLFVSEKFIDGFSKFEFFGTLAETASAAIENEPEISASNLCRKVIEKA